VSDIVERLRAMTGPHQPNVCTEAADEIERLRLNDDEREAIVVASAYMEKLGNRNTSVQETLMALLARTK
jgi:hypothetical protein